MPKQIFDQQRPRSTMARRLDEAFVGCDEWTVITAPKRRSSLNLSLAPSDATQVFDGAKLLTARALK